MDLFKNQQHEVFHPPAQNMDFPSFDMKAFPHFEENVESKTGKGIEKGIEIVKKAAGFYMYGLGLTALLIFLPTMLRFLYEFSQWAFDAVGNIFPK